VEGEWGKRELEKGKRESSSWAEKNKEGGRWWIRRRSGRNRVRGEGGWDEGVSKEEEERSTGF